MKKQVLIIPTSSVLARQEEHNLPSLSSRASNKCVPDTHTHTHTRARTQAPGRAYIDRSHPLERLYMITQCNYVSALQLLRSKRAHGPREDLRNDQDDTSRLALSRAPPPTHARSSLPYPTRHTVLGPHHFLASRGAELTASRRCV